MNCESFKRPNTTRPSKRRLAGMPVTLAGTGPAKELAGSRNTSFEQPWRHIHITAISRAERWPSPAWCAIFNGTPAILARFDLAISRKTRFPTLLAIMSTSPDSLQRTPLHEVHKALGAKMVPFAGWEMPVQYPTGISAEHKAVRTGAGLFDVSHMGEFIVRGERALEFCNYMVSNDVSRIVEGQAQYAGLLNERGTFVDDLLTYRFADRMMFVVNASNAPKDLEHILGYADQFGVEVEDVSSSMALLALQGPDAERVLQPLTPADLAGIKTYHCVEEMVAGVPDVIVSRTGYTGEAGFELYLPAERAVEVWQAITRDSSVVPCGLGARDTLRLEAGLLLYGNDIDDTVTPLEAGLGWTVKMQKGDFVGREALAAQKEAGVQRKLVGFTFEERAIARSGYPVFAPDGSPSGTVCSGTMSPTLSIPIGTCYLPAGSTDEGTRFEVEVRGRRVPAVVRKLPFYKRGG